MDNRQQAIEFLENHFQLHQRKILGLQDDIEEFGYKSEGKLGWRRKCDGWNERPLLSGAEMAIVNGQL